MPTGEALLYSADKLTASECPAQSSATPEGGVSLEPWCGDGVEAECATEPQ